MEINIKIEGLNQLTEALALIGSALAYKNNMVKTSAEAVELLMEVTDKIEDHTEEEKIKKDIVEKVVTEVVQAPEEESKKDVLEKEVKEQLKEAMKSAKAETTITIEQLREVFMNKNSKQNTPKLKQILTDHGVKKVTDLEEKDFPSVLKALEEI